jgi:hypothetical protein
MAIKLPEKPDRNGGGLRRTSVIHGLGWGQNPEGTNEGTGRPELRADAL